MPGSIRSVSSSTPNRPSPSLPFLLPLLGLALLAAACAPRVSPQGETARRGRALLVGLDGASHRLIAQMRAAGELPHIDRLAREGAVGLLRPEYPILSPRIWTSMATGKKPWEHGIENWVRLDEDRPGDEPATRLYASSDRRAHAVWNILSDAGRTVAVVNWLITHPPERVNGVMISDHAVPGILAERGQFFQPLARQKFPEAKGKLGVPDTGVAYTYPADWQERVAEALGELEPLTEIENPFTPPGDNASVAAEGFARFFATDELVARLTLEIRAELGPDLLLVYLPGIDRISHYFWPGVEDPRAVPPDRRLPPDEAARIGLALRTYYRFADALVGLLAAGYGPDDLVMVVSDHGFEAGQRADEPPGVHRSEAARDGFLLLHGPGVPAGADAGRLEAVDVAPTLLAWFGLPPAKDMSGRPASYVPWDRESMPATYDATPIERPREQASPAASEILEQLRALKYIE